MLTRPTWLDPDTLSGHPAVAHAGRVWREAPAPARWGAMTAGFLALALIVLLLFFDWNWLRGPVGRMASARLHRQVTLVGDLKVHPFSFRPRAEAMDVRIAEPDWARETSIKEGKHGDMIRVGRVAVQIRLWPLLKGQTILPLLEFDRPDVRLRRLADGRSNWTFSDNTRKAGLKLPAIQHLIIDDGVLKVDDARKKITFVGTVSSNERATGAGRGVFHLDGDGRLNGEAFTARVTGAPMLNVSPDRPYPFKAEVTSGPSHVLADGDITKPFNLGRFQTALDITGPNLNRLYDLTGLAFPNTPPYHLKARLSRDGPHWKIEGISGHVGDSDLAGVITVDSTNHRPYLTADLVSRHLEWDDMMTVFGAPPSVAKGQTYSPDQAALARTMAAQQRILPDAHLQVGRIRSMDAEVKYRAERVTDPHVPVRAASVSVKLKDGVLVAQPLRLTLPRGTVSGRIRLDASGATPVTDADLTLSDGRLQDFVTVSSGGKPAIEGGLGARIRLHGVGDSVHRAAGASSGTASVFVPGGQMRQAFAELLGVNASAGLLKLLTHDQHETPIRCAVAEFDVKNGVMSANRIVFDTGVVVAGGSGWVNLDTERMNLRLEGHSKKFRIVRVIAPITLTGPLRSPKIGVDTSKLVGQGGIGAVLGAVVSPIAAVLPFVSAGGAKDADCAALLAHAG
ncbi:MAG: AsmA family protein [Caulobacter sp.]|nr:AsmA family protein [Caulobacter sp.]